MLDLELTKKQQEALNYDGEHMLIRGIAGSGKTTVLLQKANKIITKYKQENVVLFTFNQTLASYAGELARTLNSDRLKVVTFHSWASMIMRKMGIHPRETVMGIKQKQLFEACIKELALTYTHRFFKESRYTEFLIQETAWMKGKNIYNRSDYLASERVGRGNSVHVEQGDRERIFDFFELYQEKLKRKNMCDFHDYASLIRRNMNKFPEWERIDNILIDEAQDLEEEQLRLLKDTAKKRLVIAADKGQKIYKTSFSWKSLNINISGGRTKILENSFRSTKQIIALASSLQQHDPICRNRDEEFVAPVFPKREGPTPLLVIANDHLQEEEFVVSTIQQISQLHPDWTIGLLCRNTLPLNAYERRLNTTNIPCVQLKRKLGSALTPGVKLMSFHSAKGLEFDAVILIRIRENTIPHVESGAGELDDEELAIERRLLYVSMTRAKSILYLTTYGKTSRFIDEMDLNLYKINRL